MPLVRYELRNEYSLANAELYRSAGKNEPDVLLEGVAMAGLVGIVRQLGDLAQFATEIFHDLYEEIMATAARGHELMIRVQLLEAKIPSVEKALVAGANQLHVAHTIGGDWHASIRTDQNHLTQSDLPCFMRTSYKECRGPPRFSILDKFDVGGAGACLKRYTDPSFFKTERASSQRKSENAQRERNTARLKKRVQRQRNGENAEVAVTSQQNSSAGLCRLHYSALDLAGPMCAPGNLLCIANQTLELKQREKIPSTGRALEDQAKDDLAMGEVTGFQLVKTSGKDIMHTEEKFVFVNGDKKRQVEIDLGSFDDVGGEAENFVDALTTMESEIETDSECQIKWEVDSEKVFERMETRSQACTKSHEQPVGYPFFLDVQSLYNGKFTGGVSNIQTSTASEKVLAADLDSGKQGTMVANCVSSECGNIVWRTDGSGMEVVHDHNNVKPLAPASTACNNFVQTPDAVLDHSSSFAFSNPELAPSLGCVHASEDCREKESTADLDSVNNCSIGQTTCDLTKAVLDDHPDVKPFVTAVSDVPITSASFAQQPDALLDRSSSFAFTNFESPDVSLNATTSACFDTKDAFFRFFTPELSIMYSDVKFASSMFTEEPFTVAESSAGVTDVKFQIFSSNLEKIDNSQPSFIFGHSNIIKSVSASEASKHKSREELESDLVPLITPDVGEIELEACSDVSELASGLHDVQNEHSYADLEVDNAKYEIPGECISCKKTLSEHENSSTILPGCKSQSEIEETHMESPTVNSHGKHSTEVCANQFSDSMNAKSLESSMDVESVGNQVLDVSSFEGAIQMKSVQACKGSLDTSGIISTTSNHREFKFHPELQFFQVPVNCTNVPLPENREFSGEMLGDKMLCRFDNSKVVGTVHENNLNLDSLTKDIPADMIQAELASVGHIHAPSGFASTTRNCCGRAINQFKKDETEAVEIAKCSEVSRYTMSPVTFFHSTSPAESTDSRLHNFASSEIKTGVIAEVQTGRLHAMPAASSADHIFLDNHPHDELATKHSSATFQSLHVGEQHQGYANEVSVASLSHVDAWGHDLSSSPQDEINISYSQPVIGSAFCNSFARSDYYPEIISPERSSSDIKATNLSPFCLLPEPVLPLQKELEEKGIADCISPLSNYLEKSIDEMQALKLLYTADGSKCGHQRSHAKHSSSSVSFSDHTMELATESAVLPEISMSTDEKLGSSRNLLISSLTNTLSPSTPRESTLTKIDDGSVEVGHKSSSIQPFPKPWTSTGISVSSSQSNNPHDTVFSTHQHESAGSEDLVSSSLITEPKTRGSIPQETPPPPPLPPLDWWITSPHKRSLTSIKSAAPPAPPPLPSKHRKPTKNSESQKTYIERNDSLIKAIASHDKSVLRKVIQQTQSLKAKSLTEREELFEQIRTRSFSLRRTAVKKYEIPRPATNINVSAILKKASAIRQAVGSEGDEDDDWSDA
ncbi:hypothetical protein KI387_030294 [Taxus chinensis]|uniref:Protein SCAR n=1 Tax=Taxus chinensis TaxID=29808 RepID=A0AA38CJB7_TAXCH|nr:hypothetical protein KI387_030294 [Taxus chinensis]